MRAITLFNVTAYICLALLVIFFFFPIYWIFISSLKPIEEIMTAKPRLIPERPTLENYINLFSPTALYGGFERAGKFFLYFLSNSLFVSLSTTILTVPLASIAGYALSRYSFRGSGLLSRLMLVVYLFPGILTIIPIFTIMAHFGLLNTHFSLIIVYLAITAPFCTWLIRAFFDSIPKELEEAAQIDGASRFQAFVHVILPISRPGLLTIIIFTFVTCWGEYLFSSILIFSDALKTVPPGLAMYMGYQYIEWGSLLAGSTICLLPVIALFIPVSRYFLKELTTGALKF